jgi:integrase
MAIRFSDYKSIPKSANIKIHKNDFRKFLFRFKMKVWDEKKGVYRHKQYAKVYKVQATNHSRKENIEEAQLAFLGFRDQVRTNSGKNTSKNLSLDNLFITYMQTQPDTDWTHKKKHIYDLYIGNSGLSNITKKPTEELLQKRLTYSAYKIGSMKIDAILPHHIEKIISEMANVHKLSARTQKSVIEVLNPVFNFAQKNKFIADNPVKMITVKIPSQKKIVTNATEIFKRVYKGITEYYKDEPFYQALFLFALFGRRKSEILNMKWANIDFTSDYYWIEDTKNGEKQRYPLPYVVKEQLLKIPDDKEGLVFKSPITGKQLSALDRPMKNLRNYIGIDDLTVHYLRNILVSMLAEHGTEAITLSGILGHRDINTINKYLSNSTMKSAEKGLITIDKVLTL